MISSAHAIAMFVAAAWLGYGFVPLLAIQRPRGIQRTRHAPISRQVVSFENSDSRSDGKRLKAARGERDYARMCSARKPMPITRAATRRNRGASNQRIARAGHGKERAFPGSDLDPNIRR